MWTGIINYKQLANALERYQNFKTIFDIMQTSASLWNSAFIYIVKI